MCGETERASVHAYLDGGLSPRVRGNHGISDTARRRTGSIPACAGKPAARRSIRNAYQVYPRVCGDPPPAAGVMEPYSGSIPACAGKPLNAPARMAL